MDSSEAFDKAVECIMQADILREQGLKRSQRLMLDIADAWMKLGISMEQANVYRTQRGTY